MKKPIAIISVVSALFGASIVLPGCGSVFDDRIESICSCENCGEHEREKYVIINQAEEDVANIYDCGDLLDAYWECNLQKFECKDGRYRDDNSECGNEKDQYEECTRARSSRGPGPY